jgi:Zn-dependent M28 family amino/carboxypeptidase
MTQLYRGMGGKAGPLAISPFQTAVTTLGAPSLTRLCFCGKGGKARTSTIQLFQLAASALLLLIPFTLQAQPHFNGAKALNYARDFVSIGPRWPTGPGHLKAEQFLRTHFQHDQVEEDTFTANTPIGPVAMRNFIVRFPGKKDGVIVLATHYETNYPLRNINFVGANDGAATTGLLMAIADQLRGKTLDGYSVWLVFFDGEEAIQSWSQSDSTYGSRHLAAKWGRDGTLPRVKAFMLADMIGDKDLDIQRETRSTGWLVDLVAQAAKKFHDEHYFFQTDEPVEDDHLPFVERSVPSIDVIDLDYGLNNSYHHTAQDTLDKISAHSLTIDGDVFLETIRLINAR